MKNLKLLLGAWCVMIACAAVPAAVQAESGPIRLIVPYAPGGSVDAFARVIAPSLEAKLGQTIIIDNVPGAGGVIGVGRAVKATPNGQTLLMGIVSDVILAPLTEAAATYSFQDLEAIAPLGTSGVGVVAKPSLGIHSLSALIAYARANPGKLNYGATGTGSLPALAMEAINRRAKIDIQYIAYASASKIALDVMGGHLDVAVSGLPALIEHIKTGKVTGVGVLSKEHDIGAPELPSAGDTPELKGMDFYFWTGLFAPKGTPPATISKVNTAFLQVLSDPKIQSRFKEFGVKLSEPMTPAQFGQFVARSHSEWQSILAQTSYKKAN